MLKIIGMALIVLCCSMMGILKASALSEQVTTLETTVRFYGYLYDRLKYLQSSVNSLIEQAASSREFEALKFLPYCRDKMREGKEFSESWRLAVYNSNTVISDDITQIIQNIANVLGASDLDSQLSAIAHDKSRLEQRLTEARDYAKKHRKLYQTLGVLSGLGIAIFIA